MSSSSNTSRKLTLAEKKNLRERMFVDPKVQGAIVIRIMLYWLLCQFMIAVLLYGYKVVTGCDHIEADMAIYYRCALFSTIAWLPLVVLDVVRLSNHFAGPMMRLRRAMHDLGRGEHVEPIRFRDGDFWQAVATDFSALLERVQGHSGNREPEAPLAPTPDATLEPSVASR